MIMIFTKDQVFATCDAIAPSYGFESSLIKALCLQEGAKHGNDFTPDIARLEQGFYRRYVEDKQDLATTSEVLLAASYGVMQMMGESLQELKYFQWYFDQSTIKQVLGNPLSQFAIPSALDAYCTHLNWMIDYGCKWLKRKVDIASGDIQMGLGFWNGDTSGKYASEVLAKQRGLK